MTRDQIDHLRQWLVKHELYHLSIVTHSNKIFLMLKPDEYAEDEKELFYVPLNHIKDTKEASH